ncbi:hypothetical protein MTO96_019261 [Rhipicephalus appendiculatus]
MPGRCASLASVAVLLKLALAQLEGVGPDTSHDVVTTKEASGNTTARPGSACRGRKECPPTLVCLSETCRCPELLPVLLRFDNSFACAPSRRLDERCLSHAECSHANEHARCLRSVCSCPPTFYATKASLLCLPETVAWYPVRLVALFPALAVLASAVLALGGVCYSKLLRKRRRFRVRLPRRFLPTAPQGQQKTSLRALPQVPRRPKHT